MAKAGDSYSIRLYKTHLGWGTHRYTNSRPRITKERYIPIPIEYATEFELFNSNYRKTGLGFNLFNCVSDDGFFKGTLKSGGSRSRGDIYAKQFHGAGNLKALYGWFDNIGIEPGDAIQVTFTSPTDIVLSYLSD